MRIDPIPSPLIHYQADKMTSEFTIEVDCNASTSFYIVIDGRFHLVQSGVLCTSFTLSKTSTVSFSLDARENRTEFASTRSVLISTSGRFEMSTERRLDQMVICFIPLVREAPQSKPRLMLNCEPPFMIRREWGLNTIMEQVLRRNVNLMRSDQRLGPLCFDDFAREMRNASIPRSDLIDIWNNAIAWRTKRTQHNLSSRPKSFDNHLFFNAPIWGSKRTK